MAEDKMAHLVGDAIKIYIDVLKENKLPAEKVASNLAEIVFRSMAASYTDEDFTQGTDVREKFKICVNGFKP